MSLNNYALTRWSKKKAYMDMKARTKKLNIAVLVKSFITTGGSERYAAEVTQRLLNKGHSIDLYARVADEELSAGMNLHRVPNKFGFSSVLNSLSFALETARMLRGKKYDVIHSHERGYMQDILTIHTFSYKGGTKKYSLLKKIDRIYLSPRSGIYLWLEHKQMGTPWLVAVSVAIKDDIQKYYNRNKGVFIISPGVDTDWFHPTWVRNCREEVRREERLPEDEMVVLFVGSEFRRKGLDHLIPAISKRMRLLILGRGEREDHYRRLVSKYGIADKVCFKGHIDNVRKYFAAADVVVLPSLSEAFGMSILEGMACGHPVVTSSEAGVSALVEDRVNGFTFDDPTELPNIIRRLLDPLERKRVGAQARQTAEKHTWQIAADEYEKLYHHVVETRNSSPLRYPSK
jgi:UDP-glucose:(heptosyl)LPS alpha-1,3-glucosyltransferase